MTSPDSLSSRMSLLARSMFDRLLILSCGDTNTLTALRFGLPGPIDERNIAAGYIFTISPTLINEFQIGYQRPNDTVNLRTRSCVVG